MKQWYKTLLNTTSKWQNILLSALSCHLEVVSNSL